MGNASMGPTFGRLTLPEMEPPAVEVETAAQARSSWLLNPPPDRSLERMAHHLRDFSTWETTSLERLLARLEVKLAELRPDVEKPPREWTGDTWRLAQSRCAEWGAMVAAARRVLGVRARRLTESGE